MKSHKTALYILLIYLAMQLSSVVFMRPFALFMKKRYPTMGKEELVLTINGWYIVISFAVALLLSLIVIAFNRNFWKIFKQKPESIPTSILWGVIGFFLVFVGQWIGGIIEHSLGITQASENTANLTTIADAAPVAILALAIIGPILEEFVFRRVIFGSLIQTTNFFIAALISSLVFAVIHFDFTHIIIYAISGFIFAFLYYRTRRIITSIIAHMMLNGFVTAIQLYQEPIVKFLEQHQ
ncbi:CPBP family intramembrane metalloprotease [Rummeliibacillus stabekisii]|uniref:CAAX protease n=1 Tax=Rummeliibacillus stabekisii TaxID=241244 RepID=A0A143HFX5_9BACL|nr:type II CAAX endopeptidase family protein [Rummeliibacillus stabekisii]AMX00152.1 CAAX protease [Rummeliibacillus stabekisii]MCM3318075.1 CPBP family intramembrane metalloprotease [Rummeliibacillus stabekisii]